MAPTRDTTNDKPFYERNEGRELFLHHRNTNGETQQGYRQSEAPENKTYSASHHHGPARGVNATLVDRRIEELRNGAEAGRVDGSGSSQNLNRYVSGPQRPKSGAGTKRYSTGSSDWPSKASRSSNLARPKRGDPGDPFRVTRDNCKPGTIIQGLLYEEAMDQKLIARTKQGESSAVTGIYRLGEDGEDDYWIRKNRPWVITAVYANSYTCVPLHTHNGHGLEGKHDVPGLVREFASIKEYDQDVMSLASNNLSSQSDLYVDTLYPGFRLEAGSTVWLTYKMSRRFEGKANVVGKLCHSSVRVLMHHLQNFAPHRQPIVENTWSPTDRPSNPEVYGHDRLSESVGWLY